jgi:transposase-like protein
MDRGGHDSILSIAGGLLKKHLEKYILDAYDRHTREDMVRVWEAQLKILQCPICGEPSLKRKPIILNNNMIRSWVCSDCGYHVTVQTDVLNYLKNNCATREVSVEQ